MEKCRVLCYGSIAFLLWQYRVLRWQYRVLSIVEQGFLLSGSTEVQLLVTHHMQGRGVLAAVQLLLLQCSYCCCSTVTAAAVQLLLLQYSYCCCSTVTALMGGGVARRYSKRTE
jgi:hypothetical protein